MSLHQTINSQTTESQPKQHQKNLKACWLKFLNASTVNELSFDADFLYCGASYLR